MNDKKNNYPLTFNIAVWYCMVISLIFLLYGGVKMILSVLDRSYDNMGQFLIFVIIGLIIISFTLACKQLKSWGWYGLIVLNALVIINAAIGYNHPGNIIFLVLSLVTLVFLFLPSSKQLIFKGR
ncbi:MAG: hypothetical protein GXO93_06570 [FCB group bacterium]|nr:hypothetical protein [FCB group bacterium]